VASRRFSEPEQRSPHHSLSALLLARAVNAQVATKRLAGESIKAAHDAAQRYARALRYSTLTCGSQTLEQICGLYELVMDRIPALYRTTGMFVTSHAHPDQRIAIDVLPQIIPSALAKIDTSIARNAGLDDCSRIALTYFEVLRIHPFADGNGRVASALANFELRRIRNSIPIFDLTAAVYHSLDRHNALLASTDTGVYARWREYFAGLVQTELLLQQHLSQALGQLRPIELTQLAGALEGDAATGLSAAVSRIIAGTKIAHAPQCSVECIR
jgi:hypothetical protein